jgi:tRNA pseudouridine32 synthase/23S rRNA pseudouridine746 synthase
VLKRELPQIDPLSWPERFDFGGVYVNGREALGDQALPFPCRVEYYEPKFPIATAHEIFPAMTEESIIYRDQYIAVAYKPPGLPSMPAKEQRHYSAKHQLERLLNSTIHMPSRLDVSAQGLLLVSHSKLAHAQLQQTFERRLAHKEYRCASAAALDWQQREVSLSIARDPRHPVLRIASKDQGLSAHTTFEALNTITTQNAEISIMKAIPLTGRTHQIRVHAAAIGAPLLGDRFYGGAPATHLHLVSYSVSCRHPVTNSEFTVTAPSHLLPSWIAQ